VDNSRRKPELAKIHIAKKDLGLDDDLYSDIIANIGGAKSGSAKDLTNIGRAKVLGHFRQLGWEKKGGSSGKMKYTDLDNNDGGRASGAQMRLIEALWNEVSYAGTEDAKKKALRTFLKNKTKTASSQGIEGIRFLSSWQAHKIIIALKAMEARKK